MTVRIHSPNVVQAIAPWSIAAIAGLVFVCGMLWQNASLLGGGATILCLIFYRTYSAPERAQPDAKYDDRRKTPGSGEGPRPGDATRVLQSLERDGAPTSTDALVDELFANGRYALMLRPETKQHLTQTHIVRAIRQLDEAMALVPAGRVLVGQLAEQLNAACGQTDIDPKLFQRNLVDVEAMYLDRYCISNAEYQRFIDAGGYEQLEFWHEEALPALLDFVDQSGAPGPRFWHDGQFPDGEQRLPVVGISWYEASAFARWVGKRLPSDAGWTKAAAWPIESAPGRIAQRRYPWGESFDVRRAHLYTLGASGTGAGR